MTALAPKFPAPARERAESARVRIEEKLLAGSVLTLAEMAEVGRCLPTTASARWRDICRTWEGERFELRPGLFAHRLTGKPAPLTPAKRRHAEVLEELQAALRELRATVERLERNMNEAQR